MTLEEKMVANTQEIMDNELLLFDRIEKIKSINEQYDLENNAYIAFSGGKDSTVLSYLIDLALPNNTIPRVYKDTGIEYKQVRTFVKKLCNKDNRFIYLKPDKNIKKTLNEVGYPFKSKQHSHNFSIYKNNIKLCESYKTIVINSKLMERIKAEKITEEDIKIIHDLPRGVKTFIKYYFGIRESEEYLLYSYKDCPKALQYQFTPEYATTHNYSDKCCLEFKKRILRKYEIATNRYNACTGMRTEEGGNRANLNCITNSLNGKHFNFLAPLNDNFMDWFINKYNIQLCELYYPPYNFKRTGCLCCPYSLNLQQQLDTLKEYDKGTYKQAMLLWKPIYEEYSNIGYRLNRYKHQLSIFDFIVK